MATNLLVLGAFFAYGPAAFPKYKRDELQVDGNGTTTTCDIQGFFIQFCFFSALSYYSLFSVYSYVSVPNNFRVKNFSWIEKYIHVLAHLYPLASSVVSLISEGYNPYGSHGYCGWSSTTPNYCERAPSNYAPCEHGSPETTYPLMFIIAESVILFVPTVVMGTLYLKVKRNQSSIRLQARSVANQAFVYLLMLYWVTTPMIATEIMAWKNKTDSSTDHTEMVRILIFIIIANAQCFGLFSLLVYRYFTTGEYYRQNAVIGDGNHRKTTELDTAGSAAPTERYSFNIFDGTNAGGAFAEFVVEGDSEDEAADAEETEHWSKMQGL